MIATAPPSTDHAAPVTMLARALERNTMTSAISAGSARRPSGIFDACASSASVAREPLRGARLVGEPAVAHPERRADGRRGDGVHEHGVVA